MIKHFDIALKSKERGFHLITSEVLSQIDFNISDGLLSLFIKHTSAGLTINENADPTVLHDFDASFNDLVAEDKPYYLHTIEGPDDMPAHIKSSLVGSSLTIPIRDGKLDMGVWQGIYLCEFRNHGGARKLTATLYS
jgi:secondary thiamine-phosphate synthase enzyme